MNSESQHRVCLSYSIWWVRKLGYLSTYSYWGLFLEPLTLLHSQLVPWYSCSQKKKIPWAGVGSRQSFQSRGERQGDMGQGREGPERVCYGSFIRPWLLCGRSSLVYCSLWLFAVPLQVLLVHSPPWPHPKWAMGRAPSLGACAAVVACLGPQRLF